MSLPGTAASTGLLHMPQIKIPKGVVYQQIGGFGPVSRADALAAAKQAGFVGHSRPTNVWVQVPDKPEKRDATRSKVIELLKADKIAFKEILKADSAMTGFGVYYQYGDKVIMEHTSDPESKIKRDGKIVQLPHVHVEVVDYAELANRIHPMQDRIKAINNFEIFSNNDGNSPTVERLVRLSQTDPSADLGKLKFNHHMYYEL